MSVSVLDDRGFSSASSSGHDKRGFSKEADERRVLHETYLARMIESLLEQTLGVGNVRAEVSAELDFDQVTEQSETFDPDGQVVRSSQNSNDSSQSKGANAQPTSVQQELPNVQQTEGTGSGSSAQAKKTEETTNYEISKQVKTAVKALGQLAFICSGCD